MPQTNNIDRIIQMGENPNYVFNVGSLLGLENIKNFSFNDKNIFKKKYKINFKKTIIICFHPVTLEPKTEKNIF